MGALVFSAKDSLYSCATSIISAALSASRANAAHANTIDDRTARLAAARSARVLQKKFAPDRRNREQQSKPGTSKNRQLDHV
uniref:Uncharacterized protein n=1 Tax=Pristionchus pacificus TaxID=54126 RepID=A0A2A6BIW2_PRIPA|eukprot:PDM65768.1 hypothetical protein PRIPAC_45169 [Pristionchus pacificus]